MENMINAILQKTAQWMPKLAGAVIVFLVFFLLLKIMRKIIIRAAERFDLEKNILLLLVRTSNIMLVVIGSITILGTLGVNVSALVAGLGLTGFALGFALKDTIANFLSGVLILLYRPFVIGDRIRIAGFDGIVVSIDLRYTELESDNTKILIPNSKLFTDPVVVIK